MSLKRSLLAVFVKIIRGASRLLDGNKSVRVLSNLSEDLVPTLSQITKHGKLDFYCFGGLPEWRAKTLLSKEPETIRWIDSFSKGDVLWDVGANIGSYSLYAAKIGVNILAFEPFPANYFLLNKNIELNQMSSNISSFCLAFNDKTCLDYFYVENPGLGAANNSFSEAINWQGNPLNIVFKQTVMGFTIDDFVKQFSANFPTHIKIDVDGTEDKVVAGALTVLADHRMKSLLIELDTERTDYCQKVIQQVEACGLLLNSVEHAEELDNTEASYVYNHIFKRIVLT